MNTFILLHKTIRCNGYASSSQDLWVRPERISAIQVSTVTKSPGGTPEPNAVILIDQQAIEVDERVVEILRMIVPK